MNYEGIIHRLGFTKRLTAVTDNSFFRRLQASGNPRVSDNNAGVSPIIHRLRITRPNRIFRETGPDGRAVKKKSGTGLKTSGSSGIRKICFLIFHLIWQDFLSTSRYPKWLGPMDDAKEWNSCIIFSLRTIKMPRVPRKGKSSNDQLIKRLSLPIFPKPTESNHS